MDSDTRENSQLKTDFTADDNEGGESATDTDTETDTDSNSNDDGDSSYYEALLYSADNKMHPLDLIYVIFLCADDFLRQELADKMAKCQYAIPFILPPAGHSMSPKKSMLLI